MTAWFVAFGDDGSRLKWWDVFTRPGFRHCFAFRYDLPTDCWIVFDPAFRGVHVRAFTNDAFTAYISGLTESLHKIVRCEFSNNLRVLPRFAGWCAPMCADVVRFRGIALTPYHLYCSLKRNGAEPAFEGVCRYGRDFFTPEDAET